MGLSLNKTVRALLRKALEVSPVDAQKEDELSEFLGVWRQGDLDEFNDAKSDFGNIDKRDWE